MKIATAKGGAILMFALAAMLPPASAQIAPFSSAAPGEPPSPWKRVTLAKIPRHTTYAVADAAGRRAFRAEASASYANLVHPLVADPRTTPWLSWDWKVDQMPARSDLSRKDGDDLAAKVCVFFDLPLERLSAADRWKIRVARRLFDPELPAASLCYAWDRLLPAGTVLPNVYTDRVRFIVLRSAAAGELGAWRSEKRNLEADFALAFGAEARGGTPRITGVGVASDADNTGDAARAWFGDLRLETP